MAEGEIARATPAQHPCVVHAEHVPAVLETQGHHIFPLELQAQVWPGVDRNVAASIKVPTLAWVCGTGHDNIHVLIRALLTTTTRAVRGHPREMALAMAGVEAFKAARADPNVIPVVAAP